MNGSTGGNYDLVVIDESHNFRNGADSAAKADDKENRYQKLLNKVIHSGVPTKVLMLSATPVNNRFRDLQNQLELAYGDKGDEWSRKLGLSTNIDMVFRNAQKAYGVWSKLEPEERNTKTSDGHARLRFLPYPRSGHRRAQPPPHP
mgnify:CR=1 FL=1